MPQLGVVRFENVFKEYGATQALKGATFEVPENCIAGLAGPNGAGKSTTLKITVGALRRDYGIVEVLGHDLCEEPEMVMSAKGFGR